jgi:hypothetical protein
MNEPDNTNNVFSYSSRDEVQVYRELEQLLKDWPCFQGEVLANLGLFLTRASLSRLLFMHDLYKKILDVPGCVMEFGTSWGQNLALFQSLRTIYEPQNLGRKVIGFDTFSGLPATSPEDGALMASASQAGKCTVSPNYETLLARILDCHERLGPRSHYKKYALIKGNIIDTLPAYLKEYPETLVALAYFDLGLYEPTLLSLRAITPHITKGSVIGLDHLGMSEGPGDSRAIMEVLGYRNYRFVRDPRVPFQSYVVIQ